MLRYPFFVLNTILSMTNKLTPEEEFDVNILLAMVKCISELSHGLKYKHVQKVKQKINHIVKVTSQYEKEVEKNMSKAKSDTIENIYDVIMDFLLEAREVAIKNNKNDD